MIKRSKFKIVDIVEIKSENDILFLKDEYKNVIKNKYCNEYPFVAVFIMITSVHKKITGDEFMTHVTLTVSIYKDVNDYQNRENSIAVKAWNDKNYGKKYDTSITGYAKRRLDEGNRRDSQDK